MVNDDIYCDADDACDEDLRQVLVDCIMDPSVVDEDTLMDCIAANLSDDCHDCVCEAFADAGTPCP